MEIRIDKKLAACIIVSLLIGGLIGTAIGFVAGHEHEGEHREKNRYGFEMQNQPGQYRRAGYDNHADGEMNDDQSGAPNQDEQSTSTVSSGTVQNRMMNVPTLVTSTQP